MDRDKRICVLTYQVVHRKTVDTLFRLKASGYTNVCVYAKPLHYMKKYTPMITHRPYIGEFDSLYNLGYSQIITNIGYEVQNISTYNEIDEVKNTIFLICGAGLIPAEVIHKYRFINAHPGYIPVVRGLDALKWAVIENLPLGVTTHILDDGHVDAGYVIEREKVPVFDNDTFHMVAYRQYEMEIQMLVQAIEQVGNILFYTDGEGYPIHKRMPNEIEKSLLEKFDRYKELIR